jgi:BNR repeat-like domain
MLDMDNPLSRHFGSRLAGNRVNFALLALLTFATVLRAQSLPQLPKAPGAQIFVLTPKPGSFTEPSIAINPADPKQIVSVFQDDAHASYSRDAGRSWNSAEGVAPANYKVSGDVSTTFDKNGHAFICYIAFDKLGTFNYWGHGATRNGIFVRRSLDGGKTWEAHDVPVAEQPTKPGIPFEDKPYIVSDISNTRYAGNLYVGWTRWSLTDSKILLSRSTDDGKTWSPAIEIDRTPGLPRDDNGAAEGFDGAVGPDGRLYAIWSQDNYIFLTISRDGGKTFSRARPIIHTAPIMFALEAVERANGFPQIGIDPRTQRLYVTWSDYRNGDLDVFCSTSTDHGKRWSDPVRVNNDPIHDGADQFFQWLAIDSLDGSANLAFYDRRADLTNKTQTVTLARSTDHGSTFQNYAWTTNPFNASGVFFGDYIGIAALGGRVYGTWMENVPNSSEPESKSKGNSDDEASEDGKPTRPGTVVKVGIAEFNFASERGR